MTEDINKLPAPVQERLLRLQQVQQTLQAIITQKQQIELEIGEIDTALEEMQKTADDCPIYKSVGSILVKTEKSKITTELTERRELLNTRLSVLAKQEERTRTQMKDLQTKLQQDLTPTSSFPTESPPPP
ncbi:MAG: prefoldin subunit beta [Candidatus Bathyarchaeia archaeon]|jgi:prefoldin beta subunit|nr:prefoldin subunit beta [Candidatus Bathyarchaeota archaeon A05DMB-4]MDH7595685.1 prefoldin subunit beta [Candidatus Bathyarchaeota archaeon]